MPQEKLLQLLEGIGDGSIGMDCSIVPTRFPGYFQVSTTDFFFPLVEDPYLQGRIAAANVLSDMYALGLSHCDNVLMLLGASVLMQDAHRDVVTRLMIRGFNDQCLAAGTRVTGGQTTRNEWPLIGGVAMAAAVEADFIRPELAVPGDVLVLTKPLGIQVAVNVHQWLDTLPEKWAQHGMEALLGAEAANRMYDTACESMARLNRNAALLMHKHGAHGATDVTGFGLMGHAANLARNQKAPVDFVIERLPLIRDAARVDAHVGGIWGVTRGRAAETSGGLLMAIPEERAGKLVEELQQMDGQPAWVIGRVVEGSRQCVFAPEVEIVEVDGAFSASKL